MGILGSKFQPPSQGLEDIAEGTSTNRKHGCECKKRKRNVPCDCESEPEEDDGLLDTPRRYVNNRNGEQAVPFMMCFIVLTIHLCLLFSSRKKLKSTSRYIYQTLFLNGENSDIRICALGQEWNLHKVYLCQVECRCKEYHKDGAPVTNATMTITEFFFFYYVFVVRIFLQHVQWILERVQHDGNQLGDPRPEHRH